MTKRTRTPQEKKLLSYARDGRNTVAEARSKAHKAISLRKAKANRAFRRAESRALAQAQGPDADVFVGRIGRKSWRKFPDAPLGEYVAARLAVREADGMNLSAEASPLRAAGRKRARVRPMWMKGSLQIHWARQLRMEARLRARSTEDTDTP